MKILIPNKPVQTRTAQKSGKQFAVQRAGLLDETTGISEAFDLLFFDGAQPHAPGIYELDAERSITVRDGRLEIRPVLIPAAKTKAA